MPRFAGSSLNLRHVGLAFAAAIGVVFGMGSELVAFGWEDPLRWVPDLAVGLTFVCTGVLAWSADRGTSTLLAATGYAWFAGNLSPEALYWHRGPLVHLLLTYPGWRPRSNLAAAGVAVGYIAAVGLAWRSEIGSLAVCGGLIAVLIRQRASSAGRARRDRTVALQAGVALGVALVVGTVARLVVRSDETAALALLVYEGVLCVVAVALYEGVRRPVAPAVTDLVVELGETRSDMLRETLAGTLGDPALQIGYWQPANGEYVDSSGRPMHVPQDPGDRSVRFIERDGRPLAVLIHDPGVLGDAALGEAVEAAARLTASNAALHSEVRSTVADVAASRRRLVLAADEERRRLETRLHDGPQRRLRRLAESLHAATSSQAAQSDHLERAADQLDHTIEELQALARGLHPRELADGLAAALCTAAGRCPVPVRLAVTGERFPIGVETAIYFVCAEAVANASKHARATSIRIGITRIDTAGGVAWLAATILDDGVGGADPSRGSGLKGLADRVQAVGGRLVIDSNPGRGTRLTAHVPLDQPC